MTKRQDRTLLPANMSRRRILAAGTAGMAAILASGRAPVFAQAKATQLIWAHITAPPESGAVAFEWMAKEINNRSKGALQAEFHGGTLITKEIELMNALKAGNIALGCPGGATATVFPEIGVLLIPYLVKDYAHAYALMNGKFGERLDQQFQEKYKLKTLCFFDYGFRHFWTNKAPIIEPKDLRGKKIRVQLAKVFSDTINGLGGNAVPMAWGEVVSAAKQGVIDGGDLPIVNIEALKVYEVSKFASLTYHNYGPSTLNMNLDAWNKLEPALQKLMLDLAREAQDRVRQATESVDTLDKAKALLEPRGMTVVQGNVEAFRKIAQEKIWPNYRTQFGGLFEEIEKFKA